MTQAAGIKCQSNVHIASDQCFSSCVQKCSGGDGVPIYPNTPPPKKKTGMGPRVFFLFLIDWIKNRKVPNLIISELNLYSRKTLFTHENGDQGI